MRRALTAALFTAIFTYSLGCSDTLGTVRCDELGNTCNRPYLQNAMTLLSLRARQVAVGSSVSLLSMQLTAVDTYDEDQRGSVGSVWLQGLYPVGDPSDRFSPCPITPDGSARVCGISTFSTVLAPTGYHPRVGDLVDVSGGSYDEFDCSGACGSPPQPFPDGHFLPQLREPTVRSAGVAPLATPLPVSINDILQHNQELIGLLVEVTDVTAVAAPDRRGEIAISPGRDGLKLTQELTPINGVMANTHWDRVIGVVSYFYGAKLIPRTTADLVNPQRASTTP